MKHKENVSRKIFIVVNYAVLILASLLCIAPFINILSISFSDKLAVAAGEVSFWPVNFTFKAYEFVMSSSQFSKAFLISVERVILGVAVRF